PWLYTLRLAASSRGWSVDRRGRLNASGGDAHDRRRRDRALQGLLPLRRARSSFRFPFAGYGKALLKGGEEIRDDLIRQAGALEHRLLPGQRPDRRGIAVGKGLVGDVGGDCGIRVCGRGAKRPLIVHQQLIEEDRK